MSPYERLAQRARQVVGTTATDVPSPCISLCRMNSTTELCLGCFRTLDEIASWGRMADASKLQVHCLDSIVHVAPVNSIKIFLLLDTLYRIMQAQLTS